MHNKVHVSTRYPPSWRKTCREVVEVYIRIQSDNGKLKYGTTKLLNAMAAAFTEKDPDFKREDLDRNVKRQHLEFWLKKGTEPTDQVFRFIDRFVRRLIIGPLGQVLRNELRQASIDSVYEGLTHLYDLGKSAELASISDHFPKSEVSIYSNGLSRRNRSRFSDENEPVVFLKIQGQKNGVYVGNIVLSFVPLPAADSDVISISDFQRAAQSYDVFFIGRSTEDDIQDIDRKYLCGVVVTMDSKRSCYLSDANHSPEFDFVEFRFHRGRLDLRNLKRFSYFAFNQQPRSTASSRISVALHEGKNAEDYIGNLITGYL